MILIGVIAAALLLALWLPKTSQQIADH